MSYRKLGDYIRQVNVRNKDLDIQTLLGVSNTKKMIPSIANIVGTDMSTYKIIEKRQFAYGTVTSRNGDRLSVAISEDYDKALVSQIYIVFEVIDEKTLLPEYLMMWFSRPEFDRYARFHSHGSTRESFDWEDMCEVELPVPSIEEQQKIVDQYQSVANKIKVNEQICEKLEATAQALYKHWFVDFEFPNDDGNSYFSSGGKMIFNEELQKEIPDGWEVGRIADLVSTQYGFTDVANSISGSAKFLRITDVVGDCIEWNKVPYCNIYENEIDKYLIEFGDILISRTGANVGFGKMIWKSFPRSVFASFLVRLKPQSQDYISYLNCVVISKFYKDFVLNNAEGSAQPQANANILTKLECTIPDSKVSQNFNFVSFPIFDFKENIEIQTQKLIQLQSLLLFRLARLEEI
ncbi:restriction endonuclease subunit S [Rhizosphaericola mali]|uniref:Type I restriction modification DNA specificity domain-containing protein n=1 Tax=Rhizosphaericola mali TaxID=2545455 RepID=A0A5P2GAD7_9BACT|nr:restriction endonuclease subunit S [Rhizosphaericola mali]QES88511.1 hypothetical protein E0W69_007500 [Rhizosphaericola mali]